MLLFLPQIILGATFLALVAGNVFQRNFRSSWILTVSGVGLAFVSLVFLRFRLPLTSGFSAWWAGEGLVSSISFSLDELSWPIAFIACGIILAFFLSDVQRAVSGPWLHWAVNLSLTIASLLAIIAGDLLSIVFFWTLVDAISVLAIFRFVEKAGERRLALGFLQTNITSSFLLLAAWILVGSSSQISELLVLVSAALRLGLFSPDFETDFADGQSSFLRLLPIASVLVLLSRMPAIEGLALYVALIALLLSALAIAFRLTNVDSDAQEIVFFERGVATIAIAVAAIGQTQAALGFGIVLLNGQALILLAQNVGRWRWLAITLSVILFSVLPLLSFSALGNSPVAVFFLVIESSLIAAWIRLALKNAPGLLPAEPWMRVINILGIILVPLIFIILGASLVRDPFLTNEIILWPGLIVLIVSVVFYFVRSRISKPLLPLRVSFAVDAIVDLGWLQSATEWVLGALGWFLRMVSRVLEGQAGVLWALLLIVLLISLAAQFALGG